MSPALSKASDTSRSDCGLCGRSTPACSRPAASASRPSSSTVARCGPRAGAAPGPASARNGILRSAFRKALLVQIIEECLCRDTVELLLDRFPGPQSQWKHVLGTVTERRHGFDQLDRQSLDLLPDYIGIGVAPLVGARRMHPLAKTIDLQAEHQPVLAMENKFRKRALRRRNDGRSDTHRLDGAEAKGVAQRREDRKVISPESLQDLAIGHWPMKLYVLCVQQFEIRVVEARLYGIDP